MTCSFPIIAASPASTELQLFDGFCSVLMNSAYPCERYVSLTGLTPSARPCVYQPPGQPAPWIETSLRFQPLGGEQGLGGAFNAPPVVGMYTYVTFVAAEQSGSSAGPSLDPSGSTKSCVWQTNGWSCGPGEGRGPEMIGPVSG